MGCGGALGGVHGRCSLGRLKQRQAQQSKPRITTRCYERKYTHVLALRYEHLREIEFVELLAITLDENVICLLHSRIFCRRSRIHELSPEHFILALRHSLGAHAHVYWFNLSCPPRYMATGNSPSRNHSRPHPSDDKKNLAGSLQMLTDTFL